LTLTPAAAKKLGAIWTEITEVFSAFASPDQQHVEYQKDLVGVLRRKPQQKPTRSFNGLLIVQLQPEVLPHDGQAWHEPARFICTPHCMHIGASLCFCALRAISAE
jgi:hypothetical protein